MDNNQGHQTTPSNVPFLDTAQLINVAVKDQATKHSTILMKMKEIIEAYPETTIRNVVVLVPIYFNDPQRQTTKDFSVNSGLNVMQTIHLSTTAAIVYGLEKKGISYAEKNIFIFYIGGGIHGLTSLFALCSRNLDVGVAAGFVSLLCGIGHNPTLSTFTCCKPSSCCYFPSASMTLDDDEEAMLKLCCKRSNLKDGYTILDLGCGWGSLVLYIAKKYTNCKVTGSSYSTTQKTYIEEKCQDLQLQNLNIIVADIGIFEMEASLLENTLSTSVI